MLRRPRLRDRFRQLLTISDTPHRVAITFAVGLFLGISPFLGFHSILALILAWIFRLNRFVILTGVFVTNPWSIVPIYTFCTWIGTLVLNTGGLIPEVDWNSLSMSTLYELDVLLKPFFVGTLLVGAISSVMSYFILRYAVKRAHEEYTWLQGGK
jgi:uncharacterized protein (DUF2062 family)